MPALPRRDGVSYVGLVLNRAGFERALAAGCDEVGMVVVATDTFNQRNQGVSDGGIRSRTWLRDRARQRTRRVSARRSRSLPLSAARSRARWRLHRVVEHRARVAAGEPVEIAIADTIGAGVPAQVTDCSARAREALARHRRCAATSTTPAIPASPMRTRRSRRASTMLDASIGGIGGCPFAPAATGNIPTEDLVYMLGRVGIETGVDPRARDRNRARGSRNSSAARCRDALPRPAAFRGHALLRRSSLSVAVMSYRLGVDVGGTFTDLLLVDEKNGRKLVRQGAEHAADQSVGVLHGSSASARARASRRPPSTTSCTAPRSRPIPC